MEGNYCDDDQEDGPQYFGCLRNINVLYELSLISSEITILKVSTFGTMPRRLNRARLRRGDGSQISKQSRAEAEELKNNVHQNLSFRGAAVVRLSDLSVGDDWHRLIDDGGNSYRITQILKIQGCLRLNKRYHVPVLVDSLSWQSKVFFQDRTLVPGLDIPQLGTTSDYNFIALDQRSLITSAKDYFQNLGTTEPWWVVDLYVTEASKF